MTYRNLFLSLLALMVFTLPMMAQENRWDGADDLDVNPLACPGDDVEFNFRTSAYNGAQAEDAPDRVGENIVIVNIPRQIGTPYFNAISRGMQAAARELGNVEVVTDAPARPNSDEQITFIENYVDRGVDGILVSANDGSAVASTLRRALEDGIHVVGYDADAEADAREWFVYPAPFNGVAKLLADTLAAQQGRDAAFAIVTSTFSTPNEARWVAELWAYVTECYPQMTWLETVEAQDDAIIAYNQAYTLISKYGGDLNGLFGMTSVITPNLADAVSQAGLCDGVAVVGLATPNDMKPYINGGCVETAILWNPVELGYAAVYVMRAVIDGTLAPGDTAFTAGRLGQLPIINGSDILLGAPTIFDADNINNFDF